MPCMYVLFVEMQDLGIQFYFFADHLLHQILVMVLKSKRIYIQLVHVIYVKSFDIYF